MKKIIFILSITLLLTTFVQGQILNPVSWSFSNIVLTDTEAKLVLKAEIKPGWHLYSQFIEDGGPIPTSFHFEPSSSYELIGRTEEKSPVIKGFDKNFEMDIAYFKTEAVFEQKIKLKASKLRVNGKLEFMVCDDHQCLPPEEVEFNIEVNTEGLNQSSSSLKGNMAPEIEKGTSSLDKQPTNRDASALSFPERVDTGINSVEWSEEANFSDQRNSFNRDQASASEGLSAGLWEVFFMGFLFGFIALFMPCIFPMIPLTVSYFTKQVGKRSAAIRNAIVYGLSIIVIYVGLGLGVTIIFDAGKLNELSGDAVFNLIFFIILMIFGISLLGAFEINLPGSWSTKADKKADKGGLLGIFFMAVVLAIASFSCTGPLIGTLLVDAANNGQYLGPFMGMLGFSISLALPFTLFAIFPGWLQSLPKSGSWLNSVKVVLGFIEIVFALKFLSNADMAYHWDILDRDVFLVLWIVLFTLLGFYLLGKIKFPHDSEVKSLSISRFFLSVFSFAFALYMVPGLWGAPLKTISGFLPHQGSQDFDLYTNNVVKSEKTSPKTVINKKYSDILHAPLGLDTFFDYGEGLAHANKVNKPVLLDFTGHSCSNCRKMESAVWADHRVKDRLENNFVIISLYTDDRTSLPQSEQYVSKITGKTVNTLGRKNVDLQIEKFGSNSQPLYVIVDGEGKSLSEPRGWNEDIPAYIKFLDDAKAAFDQNNTN